MNLCILIILVSQINPASLANICGYFWNKIGYESETLTEKCALSTGDCCTECTEYAGDIACAGFFYNTTSKICSLKSKLGPLVASDLQDLVIGYPVNSVHECAFECVENTECISFTFKVNGGVCGLFGDLPNNSVNLLQPLQDGVTIFILKAEPKETHIFITGGYPNSDAIIEYIPERKQMFRRNVSVENREFHAGAIFKSHSNCKLHFIIEGGFYTESIEVFQVEPLKRVAIFKHIETELACGGVHNGFYYSIYENTIHIFDLGVGMNYSYSYEPIINASGVPVQVKFSTCLFLDKNVYIFGNNGYGDEVFKLDLDKSESYQLDSSPIELFGKKAVLFQGGIVLCGGYGVQNCMQYFPSNDTWIDFAAMPVFFIDFGLVNWGDDKLLAIGGLPNNEEIYVYSERVWSLYDTQPLAGEKTVVFNVGRY